MLSFKTLRDDIEWKQLLHRFSHFTITLTMIPINWQHYHNTDCVCAFGWLLADPSKQTAALWKLHNVLDDCTYLWKRRFGRQQNILRFQITVDNMSRMKMLQCNKNLQLFHIMFTITITNITVTIFTIIIFTTWCSNASLSVHPSYACHVTKLKNILPIFWHRTKEQSL